MMAENKYVIVTSMDYSKALDSIRHAAVSDALLNLDTPDAIYNWLVEYLAERRHFMTFEGCTSTVTTISDSVVQGSVLSPSRVHR